MDVLILCALKDEYDQVLRVTDGLLSPSWDEHSGSESLIVADASFASSDAGTLRVRATWSPRMGRESAAAVASVLIRAQPIRCLAMSGICAGRRGKVSLGDVIFADRLWSYDAGKLVNEGGKERFQGDPLQTHAPTAWVQRMQQTSAAPGATWLALRPTPSLEDQESWVILRLRVGEDPRRDASFPSACPDWGDVVRRLRTRKWTDEDLRLTELGARHAADLALTHQGEPPRPAAFRTHVGPIATGAAVMEVEGLFERLSGSMRKVLGVDMESSALGVLGAEHRIPVVVAKGVSDFADGLKDDRFRTFAARASAECLIAFLRASADLIRGRGSQNGTDRSPDAVLQPKGQTSRPDRAPLHDVTGRRHAADLIRALAEVYPDVRDARMLWERAGGVASDVENVAHPRDLWQRLWGRSTHGASARPMAILRAALEDYPSNSVFLQHLEGLDEG